MTKVLVVEDAPAVRLSVADTLETLGLDVLQAEHGGVAISALEKGGIDLVVTDVLMPEVDGVELIKTMRRRFPGVKVLAMSGGAPNLPAGYVLKMTEMFNADAVLYKPFLNDELCTAVTRLLAPDAAA